MCCVDAAVAPDRVKPFLVPSVYPSEPDRGTFPHTDCAIRGDSSTRRNTAMHSLQQRLFGFALIGTLLLSTVTAWGQTQAPPQTKQTRGGRLFGTIASISDGSLVLTTRRGQSVTVHMSSTTRILGHKEATLADIQSGDLVRVTATKAG